MLTLHLEGAGVRVASARDGAAGLQEVRRRHPAAGLTAVGDTRAQADAAYRRAEKILLDEARPLCRSSPFLGPRRRHSRPDEAP